MNKIIISISGLGYVGLPVAVAFSKNNYKTIGYDINKQRVNDGEEPEKLDDFEIEAYGAYIYD